MEKEEFETLLTIVGMSKRDFAEATGMNKNTVYNWGTSGKNIPTWVRSWLENHVKAMGLEMDPVSIFSKHCFEDFKELTIKGEADEMLLIFRRRQDINNDRLKENGIRQANVRVSCYIMDDGLIIQDPRHHDIAWLFEKVNGLSSYEELEHLKKEVEELKKEKGKDDQ